ncbi:unnamed protein product [Microthlaspi erraticum]|uniref:Helitron helicase-like domain-containing protein n=1 Tax=Microthlaspi erraticum TaxID=1685480 RepID=A0A6D2HM56_9BRAS|nr:unnamed protein product [Microthlaspi erraticum]
MITEQCSLQPIPNANSIINRAEIQPSLKVPTLQTAPSQPVDTEREEQLYDLQNDDEGDITSSHVNYGNNESPRDVIADNTEDPTNLTFQGNLHCRRMDIMTTGTQYTNANIVLHAYGSTRGLRRRGPKPSRFSLTVICKAKSSSHYCSSHLHCSRISSSVMMKYASISERIRAYNMIFSFTSIGGKIDHSVNQGRGPSIFQLHGENYHRISSLLPTSEDKAKFLRLYIHDTVNEAANRLSALSKNGKIDNKLRPELVEALIEMLDSCNPFVGAFRSYRDRFKGEPPSDDCRLVLIANRNRDARTHNMPSSSEVAALIPALQYPFLFPYGEDGFQIGIDDGFPDERKGKRKFISMREFSAFRIQDRPSESQAIVRSKRLFQQFLVDVYTMIEACRLRYLRTNQKKLRSDKYVNVVEAQNDGVTDMSKRGKRVLIPASFTGGPRYLNNNYMDAMAICKHFGFPDLFITFTCNPTWPEIFRYCKLRNLNPEDRADICCRIFKLKLDSLM